MLVFAMQFSRGGAGQVPTLIHVPSQAEADARGRRDLQGAPKRSLKTEQRTEGQVSGSEAVDGAPKSGVNTG